MQVKLRTILILKTVFIACCIIGSWTILTVKIVSENFHIQTNPLSYTSCNNFYKLKYSHLQVSNSVSNVMVIIAIVAQFGLIIGSLYRIIKIQPQTTVEIVDNHLFKLQYCLNSMTFLVYLCVVITYASFWREYYSCSIVQNQDAWVLFLVALLTLVGKSVIFVLIFYILHRFHKEMEQTIKTDSVSITRKDQSKFIANDTRQVRKMLLSQHQNPFDNDQPSGYERTQNFTKFVKNYETRAKTLAKSKKEENIVPKQNIIDKVEQQRLKGLSDQSCTPYKREDVKDVCKNIIEKLSKYGYEVEQRPYIQKVILSKKFRANIENQNQKDQHSKALAQNTNSNNLEQPTKNDLQKNPTKNQKQNEMQIILNLDTAEDPIPANVMDEKDLETIELDQIFYRQYIEKQKAQKQRKKKKMIVAKHLEQQSKRMTQNKRMKSLQNKYLEQDRVKNIQQAQMWEYASRTRDIEKFMPEELLFHLKKTNDYGLNNCTSRLTHEMNELFKDEIRQFRQEDEWKSSEKIRKHTLTYAGSNHRKTKQRKNPLQLIRGRGADR